MTTSATTVALRAPPASRASTWARLALLAVGLSLVVWLVRGVGSARVATVLAACGAWVPLIVALEIVFVSFDVVAARALLGELASRIGRPTWIRSTALAYAATILLPAGRAAGEATRAATLAPVVGATHATAVCARLQVAVLAANGIYSLIGAALLAWCGPPRSVLAAALAANGVVCAALATVLLLVVRNARVAAWLRGRFARLIDRYAADDRAPPPMSALVRATAACVVGRGVQTVQYGVVVLAVGGAASAVSALTAQSIHLVGAAVGDAIPGQVGALEGAYRMFANTLGLASDPARALSIALAVRLAQLALAALGVLVSTVAARTTRASVAR
jgi:hypothetical protein